MSEIELSPEMKLRGNKDKYALEKLLGAGKYGQVWRAVAESDGELVALKIMNPGLDGKEQRHFWSEVEILAQLAKEEEEAGDWADGVSRLPRISDAWPGDEEQPAFMAQTLAVGTPLDELLRERGWLPEREALEILRQVSRVFGFLHEGTGRSYLDFQPKNIFWDEDEERVMVIDWNLLSEVGAGKVGEDLTALARLLYRSVMGMPAPGAGAVRVLAEPLAAWAEVSRATQRILSRGLHPNETERYESTAALGEALDEALQNWEHCENEAFVQSLPEYVEFVAAGLADPDEAGLARLERAADRLSAARLYKWDSAEQLVEIETIAEPLAAWLRGAGQLALGRQYYKVPMYNEATQAFRAAEEEAWDNAGALRARRWQAAAEQARAGGYGKAGREKLAEVLTALENKEWQKAATLQADLPGAPAELLGVELAALQGLTEAARASKEEAGAAQQIIETAQARVEALPADEQALLAAVYGDLKLLAEQYRVRAAAKARIKSLAAQFTSDFDVGYGTLEAALNEVPGEPVLLEAARQLAGEERFSGEQRQKLLALVLDYLGRADEARAALWQQWRELYKEFGAGLEKRGAAVKAAAERRQAAEEARRAELTRGREAVRQAQAAETAARQAEQAAFKGKERAEAGLAEAERQAGGADRARERMAVEKAAAVKALQEAEQAKIAAESELAEAKKSHQTALKKEKENRLRVLESVIGTLWPLVFQTTRESPVIPPPTLPEERRKAILAQMQNLSGQAQNILSDPYFAEDKDSWHERWKSWSAQIDRALNPPAPEAEPESEKETQVSSGKPEKRRPAGRRKPRQSALRKDIFFSVLVPAAMIILIVFLLGAALFMLISDNSPSDAIAGLFAADIPTPTAAPTDTPLPTATSLPTFTPTPSPTNPPPPRPPPPPPRPHPHPQPPPYAAPH